MSKYHPESQIANVSANFGQRSGTENGRSSLGVKRILATNAITNVAARVKTNAKIASCTAAGIGIDIQMRDATVMGTANRAVNQV